MDYSPKSVVAEHVDDMSRDLDVCWDSENLILNCRQCHTDFSMSVRRHHCRNCGGVYCDECAPVTSRERCCWGCRNRETPGKIARKPLIELHASEGKNGWKPPAKSLRLKYGSLYDQKYLAFRRVNDIAHDAGYLEFRNKSSNSCGIKVFYSGSELYRESCRPSYRLLHPGQCLHTIFDPNEVSMDIAVLDINNGEDNSHVDSFQHIALYSLSSGNRNILLKYKGPGTILFRKVTIHKVARLPLPFLVDKRTILRSENIGSAPCRIFTSHDDASNARFNINRLHVDSQV